MKPIYITKDCIIYNDMDYGWVYGKGQPEWHRSLYKRWYDMWTRCRNPESKSYENYKDREIDDRYHLLSNYINDVETLENIDLLKENPSAWEIDKDEKNPDNRHYYLENLSIIPETLNKKERGERKSTLPKRPKKPIKGTNLKDGSIIYFDSQAEAEANGFQHSSLSKSLNGHIPHYKGYKWEYINKEEDN